MSNPKQKAKELFDKFCYAIRTEETDSGYFTNVIYAKQCALIAVDEVLGSLGQCGIYFENEDEIDFTSFFKYWEEVKRELEKL